MIYIQVLILVVMEDALAHLIASAFFVACYVLILVVMEDALALLGNRATAINSGS